MNVRKVEGRGFAGDAEQKRRFEQHAVREHGGRENRPGTTLNPQDFPGFSANSLEFRRDRLDQCGIFLHPV